MILNSSKSFLSGLNSRFFFLNLNLDARFNKGLIENCQSDINKHCKSEIVDTDDDNDSDDKDNGSK